MPDSSNPLISTLNISVISCICLPVQKGLNGFIHPISAKQKWSLFIVTVQLNEVPLRVFSYPS